MIVPQNGLVLCQEQGISANGLTIDYNQITAEAGKRKKGDQISLIEKMTEIQFQEMKPLLKNSDLLIGASVQIAGIHLAEFYQIPYFHVYYTSRFLESGSYPPFRFSVKSKGRIRNWLLWKLYKNYSNKITRNSINKYRKELGLSTVATPTELYRDNMLIATDAELDPVAPDIKVNFKQTGYWYLEEENQTVIDYSQVRDRQKIIYIGFGSMPDYTREQTRGVIEQLAEKLGLVFVVSQQLLGPKEAVKNIISIAYTPHLKLFPQVDLVIHHGGAGTTHTAAYCGKPQIIIPQMADQYYWAERVKELGVGPDFIEKDNLRIDTLGDRIGQVMANQSFHQKAQALGIKLQQKKDRLAGVLAQLGL